MTLKEKIKAMEKERSKALDEMERLSLLSPNDCYFYEGLAEGYRRAIKAVRSEEDNE